MAIREVDRFDSGDKTSSYYVKSLQRSAEFKRRDQELLKVIPAEDMRWEDCPQGRIKHVLNEEMGGRAYSVDIFIQEIPPGSRSGKHRHMAEEFIYVLEGRGHDLHWDVDPRITKDGYVWEVAPEPKRFDWEEGDVIFIPVNTIHQHFNDDPDRRVRFISGINRIFRYLGFDDLEQIEEAPSA